jgi:hypothetical protein
MNNPEADGIELVEQPQGCSLSKGLNPYFHYESYLRIL